MALMKAMRDGDLAAFQDAAQESAENAVIDVLKDGAKSAAVAAFTTILSDHRSMLTRLQQDYEGQDELKHAIHDLAREFAPVADATVVFVGDLKAFADEARGTYVPMLCEMLKTGDAASAQTMLQEAANHMKSCKDKMVNIQEQYKSIHSRVSDFAGQAESQSKSLETRADELGNRRQTGSYVAEAGAGGAAGVAVAVACVGSGPVGWCVLAASGTAIAAGTGGVALAGYYKENLDKFRENARLLIQQLEAVEVKFREQVAELETIHAKMEAVAYKTGMMEQLVQKTGGCKQVIEMVPRLEDDYGALSVNCKGFLESEEKNRKCLAMQLGLTM